jgi:hypothetical protein
MYPLPLALLATKLCGVGGMTMEQVWVDISKLDSYPSLTICPAKKVSVGMDVAANPNPVFEYPWIYMGLRTMYIKITTFQHDNNCCNVTGDIQQYMGNAYEYGLLPVAMTILKCDI